MTVLVFGAEGMLGHKVMQVLGDVRGTVRGKKPHPMLHDSRTVSSVDVRTWWKAHEVMATFQPEVIINCVGLVKQRQPDTADAIAVNALFPHQLAAYCRERGVRLIHISTDCVFDGQRGGYTESDLPDATDIYGRSKALGEISDDQTLTLRTSMIGRELSGFRSLLEWYLTQTQPVSGYTRAYFSGVTTNWLATTIRNLIYEHPDLTGLYNVAGPRISKHDLLELAGIVYGRPLPVPDDTVEIDRSLDGSAFAAATEIEAPSWESMMAGMAADPTPYEDWP